MAPRSRSLAGRIRDQLGFSIAAILILFVVLRFVGVRSTVGSFFFSVIITIALNVGLSYYYDHRARRDRDRGGRAPRRGGSDIRFRDDDH